MAKYRQFHAPPIACMRLWTRCCRRQRLSRCTTERCVDSRRELDGKLSTLSLSSSNCLLCSKYALVQLMHISLLCYLVALPFCLLQSPFVQQVRACTVDAFLCSVIFFVLLLCRIARLRFPTAICVADTRLFNWCFSAFCYFIASHCFAVFFEERFLML